MKRLILLIILILTGAAFVVPVKPVLKISSRKNPEQKYYSAAGYKNGFIISYTHSVNKGRVHDYYNRFSQKQLELYQTQFVSYGAGIPEPNETPGAIFTVTDNNYTISNLHRVVPKLTMAVGIVANHSISFGNNFNQIDGEYFLTDYFSPQTSIILEITRVNLVEYIFHKHI